LQLNTSTFFAVSAAGIESVTAGELTRLGAANVRAVPGGVYFDGSLELLYRANLWLRTATRVLRPLREFAAAHAEMLYDQVRRIPWETYLDPTKTFAVHATIAGSSSKRKEQSDDNRPCRRPDSRSKTRPPQRDSAAGGITHTQFAALKIKDAIVDRLRKEQGARPDVDVANPRFSVQAHFDRGRCTISLDSSGRSLHERGYRSDAAVAPLKETLAAAIIQLTGWDGHSPLVDPMCGSGTLVIEAALKCRNMAPGLLRKSPYPFENWPDFDRELWARIRTEAQQVALPKAPAPLFGNDIEPAAVSTARSNAHRAGVASDIRFTMASASAFLSKPAAAGPGIVVINPPYGERLGDATELTALYRTLGERLLANFGGWKAFVFAGNLNLAREIPLPAVHKHKLFNGPLPCRLLGFEIGVAT
jgi:putative N6-adenine-specific DNA methylase